MTNRIEHIMKIIKHLYMVPRNKYSLIIEIVTFFFNVFLV